MTDRIAELLEHYADALIPAGTHPGAAAPIAARRSRVNRQLFGPVLLPAAAALVVAAIAAGTFLTHQHLTAKHITSTPAHTSSGPELGTLTVPATWGPPVSRGIQRGKPADLLAQTTNQMGTVVILAARGSNGLLCYVLGYLPPAATDSIAGVGACVPGSGGLLGTAAIEVFGVAPSGGPRLTYGQAPEGTRSIELSSPRRKINVPAGDAGPTYDHHAYFIATWDLAAGTTTVRALDSRGRILATLSYPQRS